MADKFEIFIEDKGDLSVGISPVITFKAELDENMAEHLIENRILGEFKEKLEGLVKEFFEAETSYVTYDTRDLEAEKEYYEQGGEEMISGEYEIKEMKIDNITHTERTIKIELCVVTYEPSENNSYKFLTELQELLDKYAI